MSDDLREAIAKAMCENAHAEPWDREHEDNKDMWREAADIALDAITSAGWVVVPKEPNEKMALRGQAKVHDHVSSYDYGDGDSGLEVDPDASRWIWEAMLQPETD